MQLIAYPLIAIITRLMKADKNFFEKAKTQTKRKRQIIRPGVKIAADFFVSGGVFDTGLAVDPTTAAVVPTSLCLYFLYHLQALAAP